jgi:lipoprotein-anchoring transpeptidase ErfK/SrfK
MRPPGAAALAAAVAATWTTGCGSRQGVGDAFAPVSSHPRASHQLTIPPGPGTLTAWVVRQTTLHASPGGPTLAAIGPHTQFGSPDVLYAARVTAAWIGVRSEFAGNGRLGWIPRSATLLGRDEWSLAASLSRRTLTVRESGRVIARYTVGIGAARSPTPTGRFAVTDRLVTNDPGGPYGCCIIALTATAPHAIPGWGGGNRIAVHATPATETIGEPDSHGCIHVTQAQGRWLVYHIPDGTPVTISG